MPVGLNNIARRKNNQIYALIKALIRTRNHKKF